MLSVPAQQLARVYALHGTEDPVGYEIIEFVPYADRYDVWSADRVKLHLKVSRPGELWGFLKFWGRELFHYPIEYIDAFLYQCKGYWFLDDTLFTSARARSTCGFTITSAWSSKACCRACGTPCSACLTAIPIGHIPCCPC